MNQIRSVSNRPLGILLVLFLVLPLSGCISAMLRAAHTEDIRFSKKQKEVSPIPENRSRVWIFSVSGSPYQGDVGTFITFNRTPYLVAEHSYFFVDLVPGEYRITTRTRSSTICSGSALAYSCKPGGNQKMISLKEGKEYFVRMQFPKIASSITVIRTDLENSDFPFEIVSLTEALPEIEPLVYWNYSEVRMKEWIEK